MERGSADQCGSPNRDHFSRGKRGLIEGLTLVLASASPRRHELLLAAGIAHTVRPANILEQVRPGESPSDFVLRTAREKAEATECGAKEIILAADTAVSIGGEIFGKPQDEADAIRMLRQLSGQRHSVYTGICLRSRTRVISDAAITEVTFAALSEEEMREYTRNGEPHDKAGAYAIQGLASKFILHLEGCYQNVVGLPVSLVYRHLKAF